MTRYHTIAALIVLALIALLIYSLDRTSWLLAQYELSQPGTLADWIGLSPLTLGVAAALVIEVGAVALVAGDVLALERSKIQRYATAGLFVVLAVQALANLLAGYLRGYASVRSTLEAHGASANAAWWIAGIAWALSSAAVPALIFILSKLAAHVLRLAVDMPQSITAPQPLKRSLFQRLRDRWGRRRSKPSDQRSEGAQERSETPLEPEAPRTAPALLSAPVTAADDRALIEALNAQNKTARPLIVPPSAEAVIPLDRYPCPHCGRALTSGRAVGAAKTNGYCQYCKPERKAS